MVAMVGRCVWVGFVASSVLDYADDALVLYGNICTLGTLYSIIVFHYRCPGVLDAWMCLKSSIPLDRKSVV